MHRDGLLDRHGACKLQNFTAGSYSFAAAIRVFHAPGIVLWIAAAHLIRTGMTALPRKRHRCAGII
jgi:hypothetical protein